MKKENKQQKKIKVPSNIFYVNLFLIIAFYLVAFLIFFFSYDGTNLFEIMIGIGVIYIPSSYFYIYKHTYKRYISKKSNIYIDKNSLIINKIWKQDKPSKDWYKIPYKNFKEIGMTKTYFGEDLYYILTNRYLFLIDSNYPIKEEGEKNIPNFFELWNNKLRKRKDLTSEVQR
ncbi:MAG: hypothetical protein ACOC40_01255 [Thermoplasmatota archaeon]